MAGCATQKWMALRFPRETSDSERASGIRSSGDGNADVEFRHSLRPQSLDRPGRAAGQDLPVLRWRRPRSGEGQEGHSGSGFGWGFYGRPMAPVGFCRALPASNPEFHRHRGCTDRSSRGDEYSPVGCQRRAKGEQSCRGTCSVKTVSFCRLWGERIARAPPAFGILLQDAAAGQIPAPRPRGRRFQPEAESSQSMER